MFVYVGNLCKYGIDVAVYVNEVNGRYLLMHPVKEVQLPLFA